MIELRVLIYNNVTYYVHVYMRMYVCHIYIMLIIIVGCLVGWYYLYVCNLTNVK
jgi:hypothetical protein